MIGSLFGIYSAINFKYQAQNNLNQLYQQKMRLVSQPAFGLSAIAQPAVQLMGHINTLDKTLKQDAFVPSQAPVANPAALGAVDKAIDMAIEAAKAMLKMATTMYEEAVARLKEEFDLNHRLAMAWHEPSDSKKK